jgi:hypothetical protein
VAGQARQANAAADAATRESRQRLEQAAEEEARQRRFNRVELARQRSTLAKSGVRLEGTPLEQLVRNANELEQNAINARRGLLREAKEAARAAGEIRTAGRYNIAAGIIGGAANAYGSYATSSLLRQGTPYTPPKTASNYDFNRVA